MSVLVVYTYYKKSIMQENDEYIKLIADLNPVEAKRERNGRKYCKRHNNWAAHT